MKPRVLDLTGQKIGKLEVLSKDSMKWVGNFGKQITVYKCKCECGTEILRSSWQLYRLLNKCCGECKVRIIRKVK